MTLGKRLKDLRTDHGMTQQEVADSLRPPYTSPAVRFWEADKSKPRLDTLKQLADLFGVSVAYLIGEEVPGISPIASGVMVPVLGTAHMEDFEDIEDLGYKAEVPSGVMEAHPRAFLIHGFGPCMNKRYPEDALLLIDPDMEPRNGEAVLVQDDDGRALVRVFTRGSSTLMLSPDSYSENIQDIVGNPEDPPVRVVGVVVWYQSKEDIRRCV